MTVKVWVGEGQSEMGPKVAEGPLEMSSGSGWEHTGAHGVGQGTFIAGTKGGSLRRV